MRRRSRARARARGSTAAALDVARALDAVAANATRALLAAGGDDALARDAAGATPLLYTAHGGLIVTARALLADARTRGRASTVRPGASACAARALSLIHI